LKISEGFKGRHGGLTLTLSPHKTSRNHEAPSISEYTYQVRPRSVAVLWVSLSEVTQRVTDHNQEGLIRSHKGIADTDAKKGPPLPTCRICGCCLRGSAGPVFLTPVNLDSFFAARAPSICVVPSEGPLR